MRVIRILELLLDFCSVCPSFPPRFRYSASSRLSGSTLSCYSIPIQIAASSYCDKSGQNPWRKWSEPVTKVIRTRDRSDQNPWHKGWQPVIAEVSESEQTLWHVWLEPNTRVIRTCGKHKLREGKQNMVTNSCDNCGWQKEGDWDKYFGRY